MTHLEHLLLPLLTIACSGRVSQYKTRFNLNKELRWISEGCSGSHIHVAYVTAGTKRRSCRATQGAKHLPLIKVPENLFVNFK